MYNSELNNYRPKAKDVEPTVSRLRFTYFETSIFLFQILVLDIFHDNLVREITRTDNKISVPSKMPAPKLFVQYP